ncbi:MAG: Gfo/Idh/MocA family oxidoreductase [Candidatus Magasanikbacteria bacterium]|nr:Gfo/Idh/MocA family oxidoreductase [Candidatus Magasanikbacteria bacterium]
MTGKKIRIALIGAGGMGKRWARALTRARQFDVRAVVDVDRARAQQLAGLFKKCDGVVDWKVVLKRLDIDAVVIVTPHRFLAPIAQSALQHGKHVLCEKPGGIKAAEIKKTLELARKHKRRYMIGFNHRYHAGFLLVRKLYEAGKIGTPMFIRARYGFGGRAGYEKEWRMQKFISGGGELIDQGVHMIDMARSFLGDFSGVTGFAEDLFWGTGADDNAMLILKTKQKQLASIHVSWSNWKPIHNFEIFGTKGYISVEGLGRKYGGTEKVIWGRRKEGDIDHPIEKEFICDPDADKSLNKELNEFASAIRAGRDPVPSGRDGYEVLKIVEKIYKGK